MRFELINPSDKITLSAPNIRIAAAASWMLSGGFGVQGENSEDRSGIMMFHGGEEYAEEFLGSPVEKFINENEKEIGQCMTSFFYGSFTDYNEIQKALECITDEAKRTEFLQFHDDKRRSSLNQIVNQAHKLGKAILSSHQ